MTNDPLHQLSILTIIDFLASNRLPGMFPTREIVTSGQMPLAYPTCQRLPPSFRSEGPHGVRTVVGDGSCAHGERLLLGCR